MAHVVGTFTVPHPMALRQSGSPCPPHAPRASSAAAFFGFSCALAAILCAPPLFAQVLTVNTSKGTVSTNAPVDRQYQQIQPTHVALPAAPMGERSRLEIVRVMQSEQGFAMRPLPGGHKGLTLEANGKLEPAGEAYLNMATADGISVKPGDRAVITNLHIDHNKLILDLNQGPDARHRFLQHVSIGMGGDPYGNPVVPDTPVPGGARVTLVFKDHIPDLTGDQVKALLAPLLSFDVKTPVQAYTDTLPKPLKQAILDHQVLVGMNTDMVMFAKGEPEQKYHEMDGQMPIDIWIYGKPPQDVTFVRINGNQVLRVELAKSGQPLQVFSTNVVAPMMTAAGMPTVEQAENVHVIHEGDAHRDPNTQAAAPPPTLRNPGEAAPSGQGSTKGQVMRPVYFPKPQPDSQADPYPDGHGQGSTTTSSNGQGSGQSTQSGTAQPVTTPSSASGKTSSAPAAGTPAQPPANQPATVGSNPDDQQN